MTFEADLFFLQELGTDSKKIVARMLKRLQAWEAKAKKQDNQLIEQRYEELETLANFLAAAADISNTAPMAIKQAYYKGYNKAKNQKQGNFIKGVLTKDQREAYRNYTINQAKLQQPELF